MGAAMTDRELMQQALDALFMFVEYDYQGNPLGGAHFNGHRAIQALRARLAQPERAWQGLTDEEMRGVWDDHVVPMFGRKHMNPIVFGRIIEAKLKEKNT